MKKTICLMLVALLLVAVMAPTAYATARGETVTVTVTVTGDAFAGLSGTMSYDADALTYVSCSSSTGTPMFNANGGYFSWYTNENVSGTVSTISVTFTVKEDAPCGSAGVSVSDVLVGNQDGVAVDASVSVSSVSVDHIPGEASNENDTPSTCSVPGGYDVIVRCTKCNEIISSEHVAYELAAHTESVVNGYPATCTEDGLTDGIVCSVCGYVIKAQEVIPAGHKWELVSSEKGSDCQHYGVDKYICSVCGEPKEETNQLLGDHKYEAVPNDGKHTHNWVCSVCGAVGIENEKCTDADNDDKCDHCGQKMPEAPTVKPDPDIPPTSDTTPYPVFILMAVAAVMGTAYGFKRKFEI